MSETPGKNYEAPSTDQLATIGTLVTSLTPSIEEVEARSAVQGIPTDATATSVYNFRDGRQVRVLDYTKLPEVYQYQEDHKNDLYYVCSTTSDDMPTFYRVSQDPNSGESFLMVDSPIINNTDGVGMPRDFADQMEIILAQLEANIDMLDEIEFADELGFTKANAGQAQDLIALLQDAQVNGELHR